MRTMIRGTVVLAPQTKDGAFFAYGLRLYTRTMNLEHHEHDLILL